MWIFLELALEWFSRTHFKVKSRKKSKNEIENVGVQGIAFSRYSSLVTFSFS
jgi:hypothetical protein